MLVCPMERGGQTETKEIGLCSKVTRITAEGILQDISSRSMKDRTRCREKGSTFESFIELMYLPVYNGNGRTRPRTQRRTEYDIIWFGNSATGRMR